MKYLKGFGLMVIIISMVSLVMMEKKEISTKSYDYVGENINGKLALNSLKDGYGIVFYPSEAIGNQHISADSYTFNFYNEKNEIVLNTALTVFSSDIKDSITTKLFGMKNRDLQITRVVIITRNAEYHMQLQKNATKRE